MARFGAYSNRYFHPQKHQTAYDTTPSNRRRAVARLPVFSMDTYWEKRRETLEKMNKKMRDAFGRYAAWQSLLNQPRAFSYNADMQSRADAARARIQTKADAAYEAYQSAKNEIDIFVYPPLQHEPEQMRFI